VDRRQATWPLVADLDGTVDRPGPRFRLSRGPLSAARPAVIVLHEPTNHLDITSTQVMERALTHFPGAVIVVSHDRFFVDKLADRLLVFDGGPRVRETAATGAL
jgi:ATP-binding cassette subfamily F protein 3